MEEKQLNKIIINAVNKGKLIEKEYREKERKLIEQKKIELAEYRTRQKEKILKEAEKQYQKSLQQSRLELNNKIIQVKQQLLNDVFQHVADRLTSLPREDYQNFFQDKILRHIETGMWTLFISAKDEDRITEEFISKVAAKLNGSDSHDIQISLSRDRINIKAGLILKSDKLQINFSIVSLIKYLKERIEPKVIKRLFKE